MKFRVRWGVDDGYAGAARPQEFTIDIEDMAESCDTEEEANRYLYAEVQAEFENHITWFINNEDEVLQAWRDAKAPGGSR